MLFTPALPAWPTSALPGLQVLCGSHEYAEQMGAILWPAFAAAYVSAKLKPIQPQSDAEVWVCACSLAPASLHACLRACLSSPSVLPQCQLRSSGHLHGSAIVYCLQADSHNTCRKPPVLLALHSGQCLYLLCCLLCHLLFRCIQGNFCTAFLGRLLCRLLYRLQVELYSRKSSLGAKLEQKAVSLHLLPGGWA